MTLHIDSRRVWWMAVAALVAGLSLFAALQTAVQDEARAGGINTISFAPTSGGLGTLATPYDVDPWVSNADNFDLTFTTSSPVDYLAYSNSADSSSFSSFGPTSGTTIDQAVLYETAPGTYSTVVTLKSGGSGGSTVATFTVYYTILDVTPPEVTITVPADGVSYELGSTLNAAYSCTDDALDTCVGTDDGAPHATGAAIDTTSSALGPHTFTVIGTDLSSNETTVVNSYTIVDTTDPDVTITTPPDNAEYDLGEVVNADYDCTDLDPLSCIGDVDDTDPIDTSVPGPQTFTVTGTDNSANETVVVHAYTVKSIDLKVTKDVDDATPQEGDTVEFTVTVKNIGDVAASGVVLTEVIPPELTSVTITDSGSTSFAGSTWTVGALAVDASETLTIKGTVDVGTSGDTITNTAAVSASTETDPFPGNDSADASFTVRTVDIEVTKSHNVADGIEAPGQQVEYTVTVTNVSNPDTDATGSVSTMARNRLSRSVPKGVEDLVKL